MEDRELLEAAAKAAGLNFRVGREWHNKGVILVDDRSWDPLTDDGDALRLAVARWIDVAFIGEATIQARAGDGPIATEYVCIGEDSAAATRRAIVRAAAATENAQDA